MSAFVKITDLDLTSKIVMVREDYNVPLKDGAVTDDTRIRATLPTIKQLLEAKARVILVSHLGRPVAGEYEENFSLAPVAKRLGELLGFEVPLIKDWVNGFNMGEYKLVLCENVRFEKGEITDSETLSRKMAKLCRVYINDAFATAHRAQASTHGVAKYAAVSAAGPLLITELKALSKGLHDPEKPLVAIVGGSKVSTKLNILKTMVDKVDQLIVGGGIANTLLRAAGYEIGRSLFEPELVGVAKKLMGDARVGGCEIQLPVDVVCGKELEEGARASIKSIDATEPDDLILDIGPETSRQFNVYIKHAKTIVWNGPLGVFEFDQFGHGTEGLAMAIANSKAYSLAGGGDTIAAISKFNVTDNISYISTGGGAFLEFLEGKKLPAIELLEEAARAWVAMEKAREL